MLRFFLPVTVLLLLFPCVMSAQIDPDDPMQEYYMEWESASTLPEPEYELFYLDVKNGKSIFRRLTDYMPVRYSRRGYSGTFDRTYFGAVDLSGGTTYRRDYSFSTILRSSRLRADYFEPSMPQDGFSGAVSNRETFSPAVGSLANGGNASFTFADKNYRGRVRTSEVAHLKGGWSLIADLSAKAGRDGHVKGVFTEEATWLAGIEKAFNQSAVLSLYSLGVKSIMGTRAYTVQEAFDLTGDNMYNPTWGYYNGKIRNSRVNRRSRQMWVLNGDFLASESTTLNAALSYMQGLYSMSGLTWYNAPNPLPDYYRNLPSYMSNTVSAGLAQEEWRLKNDITRIDWDNLWEVNYFNPLSAVYAVAGRVEKAKDAQFIFSGKTLAGNKTQVHYGLRGRSETTNYFRRLDDMLGGTPFPDLDPYLYINYPGLDINDIRNTERVIKKTNKYAYNYDLKSLSGELFASAEYTDNHYSVSGSVNAGLSSFRRVGHYEKQLFPGEESYGKSEEARFETYSASFTASYSPTARHRIAASFSAGAYAPRPEGIFLNPEYRNSLIDDFSVYTAYSAEATYTYISDRFQTGVSLYYTKTNNQSSVRHFYDVVQHSFCDMVLTGIDKAYSGIELTAGLEISSSFTLDVVASMGSFRYASDPDAEIMLHATGGVLSSGTKSYLKDYRLATAPEKNVVARLSYSRRGWLASLTYSYMADRFVTAEPMRRMEQYYNLAASEEHFTSYVEQERVPNAYTVDLFVMKYFTVAKKRWSAMFAVRNVLAADNIVYGGYEQTRLRSTGSDGERYFLPFASKYLYAYPRTFNLTLSCGF